MKASNPHSRQAKDRRVYELTHARIVTSSDTGKGGRVLNDHDAKMMVVRACR